MDFVAYLKMVTTRVVWEKKLLGEMHYNSITIKDFGVQFSRNASDGKSHNPHVPSDVRDGE
ncbi:MAG: hypothetical protein WKF36_08930 [Candidatus Nitrosocosmicus sp.]